MSSAPLHALADADAALRDRGPEVATSLTRTLAAFGACSVAVGGALALTSTSPTARAFGQQTASWGAINLGIAGFGAWRARSTPAEEAGLHPGFIITKIDGIPVEQILAETQERLAPPYNEQGRVDLLTRHLLSLIYGEPGTCVNLEPVMHF